MSSTQKVGTILAQTRAQTTGAIIAVEVTGPGSTIEQEPGYATICYAHGGANVIHETYALAMTFKAHPEEFCEGCTAIVAGEAPKLTKAEAELAHAGE